MAKASVKQRLWIGLDPGTFCGYAVLDTEGVRVLSGIWDLSARRHEGAGFRFLRLERWLGELITTYEAEGYALALGYEEVASHKGVAAAHIYGGVVATIQRVCEVEEVPYTGVPVGTVKKLATGKGNANKEVVMEAARVRWPNVELDGDDEADALWVAETLRLGHA